jgi:hypothetical protein
MSTLNYYDPDTLDSDIEDLIFEDLHDAFNKIRRIKNQNKIAQKKAVALDKKIRRFEHERDWCVSNSKLPTIYHSQSLPAL